MFAGAELGRLHPSRGEIPLTKLTLVTLALVAAAAYSAQASAAGSNAARRAHASATTAVSSKTTDCVRAPNVGSFRDGSVHRAALHARHDALMTRSKKPRTSGPGLLASSIEASSIPACRSSRRAYRRRRRRIRACRRPASCETPAGVPVMMMSPAASFTCCESCQMISGTFQISSVRSPFCASLPLTVSQILPACRVTDLRGRLDRGAGRGIVERLADLPGPLLLARRRSGGRGGSGRCRPHSRRHARAPCRRECSSPPLFIATTSSTS